MSLLKKTIRKTAILGIGMQLLMSAYAQNKPWALPPTVFNMNVDPPTSSAIPGSMTSSGNPYVASNGAYDQNGNLLFYIEDLKVYSPNSIHLTTLPIYTTTSGGTNYDLPGSEISIVPVPGSGYCNKFYVIYELEGSSAMGGGGSCLGYVMIDCTGSTPVMNVPTNGVNSTNFLGLHTWTYGIAVSKLTSSNIRYLFTLNQGVDRYTINTWPTGINSNTQIVSALTLGNSSSDPSEWHNISELEISPDQSRLAWTTNLNPGSFLKVPEITLTSSYTYSGTLTYNLPKYTSWADMIYGLEYNSSSNKLYASTFDGIFYLTPGISPNVTHISSSASFGKTQLELMTLNNNILGADNTGKLYKINTATNTITSNYNNTVIYSNRFLFSSFPNIYRLPEQIDGNENTVYPTLTATIPSYISTICKGNSITLTGSYSGTTVPDHYYWEIIECTSTGTPIGSLIWSSWYSGAPSGSFTIPNSSTLTCNKYYKVKLAVQNLSICFPWAETSKIIFIKCPPNTAASEDITICSGSCTTLSSEEANPIPGISYVWTSPTGIISNTNQVQVCPTSTTTYTLTESFKGGCSSSDPVTVTVVSNHATFSYSDDPTPINYYTITVTPTYPNEATLPGWGDTWTIQELDPNNLNLILSSVQSGANGTQCWWTYGGPLSFPGYDGLQSSPTINCGAGPAYSTPNPSIGHFSYGKYYRIIRTTWNSYCSWVQSSFDSYRPTRNMMISNNNIISEDKNNLSENLFTADEKDIELKIYPNPSNGIFNLQLGTITEKFHLEVFDMTGRKVTSTEINNNYSLDLSEYSKGIYMIKVITNNKSITKKIILE
jgi:hypothetical protein